MPGAALVAHIAHHALGVDEVTGQEVRVRHLSAAVIAYVDDERTAAAEAAQGGVDIALTESLGEARDADVAYAVLPVVVVLEPGVAQRPSDAVVLPEVVLDEAAIAPSGVVALPAPVATLVEGRDEIDVPVLELGEQPRQDEEERVAGHLGAELAAPLQPHVSPARVLGELEIEVAVVAVERLPKDVEVAEAIIREVLLCRAGAQPRDEEEGRHKDSEEAGSSVV